MGRVTAVRVPWSCTKPRKTWRLLACKGVWCEWKTRLMALLQKTKSKFEKTPFQIKTNIFINRTGACPRSLRSKTWANGCGKPMVMMLVMEKRNSRMILDKLVNPCILFICSFGIGYFNVVSDCSTYSFQKARSCKLCSQPLPSASTSESTRLQSSQFHRPVCKTFTWTLGLLISRRVPNTVLLVAGHRTTNTTSISIPSWSGAWNRTEKPLTWSSSRTWRTRRCSRFTPSQLALWMDNARLW